MRIPIVDQVLSLVRKPAAASARTSQPREDRLRDVFESVPIGLAATTADGHWMFVNDRFRTLIGYTRGELSRITLHGITHPDDAKEELALMKRLVAGEIERYRIEKRIMTKEGRYVTLLVATTLAADLILYAMDEPAPSPLDALGSVAVILSDQKGTITGWNRGAQELLGYRRSQIIGKNRRQLYRDTDVWSGKSTGALTSASADRQEMNDWRVRADGTHLWVRCSLSPFEIDGKPHGFIETITTLADVDTTPLKTELEKRKRTEEALREAYDDLRRTSEETMNELRIMTGALRNEIERRKSVEEELRKVSAELASLPPAIEVEVEEIAIVGAPPQRAWQSLGAPDALLRACAEQQRTGTLLVSNGSREKEIFFEEGRLFSCASNDPSKFLAERLVANGIISEDDRQRAVEIKRASQLAMGRILLILGCIEEAQLVAAMRRKLGDEIDELLTWTEGQYVFVDGEVPSLQLVPLRIDVETLLTPQVVFIASTKSGKVHQPACMSAKRISGAARVEVRSTQGFELCRQCFR